MNYDDRYALQGTLTHSQHWVMAAACDGYGQCVYDGLEYCLFYSTCVNFDFILFFFHAFGFVPF